MARPPLISKVRIENYRALRDLSVNDLGPFTAVIGPNGSGKSTFFDVFAFLSDCFVLGVRQAPSKRNSRLLTYRLEIVEHEERPVVGREVLRWTIAPGSGRPKRILDFQQGQGSVYEERTGETIRQDLTEPDVLAVSALGFFKEHPRVEALRRFISGWYMSYLSADNGRGVPVAGPQQRLSRTGDNLVNVLQYLRERHPDRLAAIVDALRGSIPRLQEVNHDKTQDGRRVLWFRDEPFEEPVLARNVSDGTLKMLAYYTLLNDPTPPPFIGIEEPENHVYFSLLPGLADACRTAADLSQILVTTHSREFVNAGEPEEVLVIFRDPNGYAQTLRPRDMPTVEDQVAAGGRLGWLWQEGYIEPLPRPRTSVTQTDAA